MKYIYIKLCLHFNLFYALILIRIIIITYNCLISGEIYHCDDIPSDENASDSTWYNNYQTRNEEARYPTRHSDGTPLYEPYKEGLQSTSKGLRYELPTNEKAVRFEDSGPFFPREERNLDNFIAELDGKPVYVTYDHTDMQGKDFYSYSYYGSTMIGEIEPTKSEVIGNGYYKGSGWTIVQKVPNTTSRRIYNKVKTSVKNHIAKSSDEAIREHNRKARDYAEYRQRVISMEKARKAQRVNDMFSSRPDKNIIRNTRKVRKFD